MDYVYLHGFASGPSSAKAKYLRDRFRSRDVSLTLPDLNQGGFTHLTLTRQIHQVEASLSPLRPVTLMGSSFGGLTAAWVGDRQPQVERLILLAPAFQFLDHWLPSLGAETLERWREDGYVSVYHHAAQRELPLSYALILDVQRYDEATLRRPIPTLILHGTHDEVIPLQASRDFAAQRPWVKLVELPSDHTLGNVTGQIWQQIQAFCPWIPQQDVDSQST